MRNRAKRKRWKPAASARVHLLLAAMLWTTVGAMLVTLGVRQALDAETFPASIVLASAALVGLLKAKFVLQRAARRAIERIRDRGDGNCMGGFFSVRTWAFVVLMAGTGRVLRTGILPPTILAFICTTVGVALLAAAIWFWRAWYVQQNVKVIDSEP